MEIKNSSEKLDIGDLNDVKKYQDIAYKYRQEYTAYKRKAENLQSQIDRKLVKEYDIPKVKTQIRDYENKAAKAKHEMDRYNDMAKREMNRMRSFRGVESIDKKEDDRKHMTKAECDQAVLRKLEARKNATEKIDTRRAEGFSVDEDLNKMESNVEIGTSGPCADVCRKSHVVVGFHS